MRTFVKIFFPAVVVTAGLLINVSIGSAKPEYTKKEKKSCTYCHTAANSKELNDAGKYYAAHEHSLEGYAARK